MNSNRSSKPKPSGKAKGKNVPKKNKQNDRQPRELGAAIHDKPSKSIGMRDLMLHDVSFIAGYIFVGNGTLGATDGVYFEDISKNLIDQADDGATVEGGYQIPFSPVACSAGQSSSPTPLYPSYVSDIMKHFARFRVRKSKIELISLQPATSNSMIVQISPVRGAGDSANCVLSAGTAAGATFANTVGMAGSRSATSWQNLEVDMTSYCAGGSGAQQNEFTCDALTEVLATGGISNLANQLSIPSAFVVSGQNNTTALRGTQTHAVVFRFTLDLLDFVAGVTALTTPSAFAAAMIKKPSAEIHAFVRALGGETLVRLLESRSKEFRKEKEKDLLGHC